MNELRESGSPSNGATSEARNLNRLRSVDGAWLDDCLWAMLDWGSTEGSKRSSGRFNGASSLEEMFSGSHWLEEYWTCSGATLSFAGLTRDQPVVFEYGLKDIGCATRYI